MRVQSQIESPKPLTAAISSRPYSTTRSRLRDAVALMGGVIPYAENIEIFGEGEPAEYVYQVVRGTVRTYKLTNDGRRQIGAFYLPGDIFGLSAGPINQMTAEAVSDSRIRVLKKSSVAALAARDAAIAGELWAITARELERLQELTLALGRKTALERVAGFLLDMAARGRDGAVLQLPMSREDIADYLGLTVETVCRTIAQLGDTSVINVPSSRRIILHNREALAQLSG